ncbi:MAG: phosphoserine transaminase [Candidatus Margulisiibacteriota bacterium]
MTERIVNFSAGPAAIPEAVLLEAQQDLFNYQGTGLSIMEMSHRSKAYDEVHSQAIQNLKTLLCIPENYSVLFLQGGASQQFAMLPMNLIQQSGSVDVIHTGSWTKKAIGELKKGYNYNIVASNEDQNHLVLPDLSDVIFNDQAAYTYMCSNNTIFGTQFKTFPTHAKSPLVVDMSSDILSRQLNIADFGLIFAGAQKNIGPSGVTVVIIRDDLLARSPESIPVFFNYQSHATANSLYNTPPTFGIYMANLVFKYLLDQGGLAAQEERNFHKAKMMYNAIESSDQFYCPVPDTDRSAMNVVFRQKDHNEAIEADFIASAKAAGFDGLKGHRSVGGLRASTYNAQTIDNIERFSQFIMAYTPTNVTA